MTQPVGAEEGVGLLFRNGAFLTSVRYTLVAFENERDGSSAERTVVYTAVLHFESAASECSRLLDGGGHLLALETAQGLRMACRPVEALGASRLRWIVRLT
jgi:hypothetical protein